MVTYAPRDYEEIATAVNVTVARVAEHARAFEAAALWYRLDTSRPPRQAPSAMLTKLKQIENSARRLLKHLGIDDPRAAADGPGSQDVLWALTFPEGSSEDLVIEATRRVGRLIEIIEATKSAALLADSAADAAEETARLGRLTVPKGHVGDDAVNGWIAAMLELYRLITGREPATSVGAPGQAEEGVAGGPLIRFLGAAGRPLGMEYSPDAWRSRIRTILDSK